MGQTPAQRIADVQARAPNVSRGELVAHVSRWSSILVGARLAARGGGLGLATFGVALGSSYAGAGAAQLLHTSDLLASGLEKLGYHRIGQGGPHPGTVGHQVAHSRAFAGFLTAVGIGLAAAFATVLVVGSGGTAAVLIGAGVAAFGASFVGSTIGGAMAQLGAHTGPIVTGSFDVWVGGKPAARMTDVAACAKESAPTPLVQGCASILINGLPLARIGHKLLCGAILDQGEPSVTIDEATVQCADPEPEVPVWARVAADWLGIVPLGRVARYVAERATLKEATLNERFGTLEKPHSPVYEDGVKPFEKRPDGEVLMNPTLQSSKSGQTLVLDPSKKYLWVIDKDGNVLVGEELEVGPGQKLGHPTLTGGKNARIGGELNWDPEQGNWKVNDDSGRYSRMYDRTEAQLGEAAGVLEHAGVDVGAVVPRAKQ